jgi:hypothetical protein
MKKTQSHDQSSLPDSSRSSQRGNRSLGGKSKVGGIAIIVLAVIYALAAPRLNARYGWSLPELMADSSGNVRLKPAPAKIATDKTTQNSSQPKPANLESKSSEANRSPAPPANAQPGAKEVSRGPLADRMRPTSRSVEAPTKTEPTKQPEKQPNKSAAEPAATEPATDLLYGLLREVSRDRYVSPQGLLYTPGSAEGHRLEHLKRHTVDDPNRPGSHGVFDGEMEGALKTIDRAYEKAKNNERTTTEVQDGRTIYTVDMGGRVGYVGGRDGNRKRKPMARRVQLVLEGNRVITAYPK